MAEAMSVERIVGKSRRAYRCERCRKLIEKGSRRRQRVYFYNDVDGFRGDPPLTANWHLNCEPWS